MRDRCCKPEHQAYANYGGRGITVCDRWLASYEAFLADVGPRPGPEYSLDRFPDKNGNYEPGNVRWATWSEQARNTRKSVLVMFQGREMPLGDACEIVGLPLNTAHMRMHKGWPIERVLSTPLDPGRSARQRASMLARCGVCDGAENSAAR